MIRLSSAWTTPATDADPSTPMGVVLALAILALTSSAAVLLWDRWERRRELQRRRRQYARPAVRSRWADDPRHENTIYDLWRGGR